MPIEAELPAEGSLGQIKTDTLTEPTVMLAGDQGLLKLAALKIRALLQIIRHRDAI